MATPDSEATEVYVDDPIIAIRGTVQVRRAQVAGAVLEWAALGIHLAIKKGQFGSTANWIGATFRVLARAIEARIQQQRL